MRAHAKDFNIINNNIINNNKNIFGLQPKLLKFLYYFKKKQMSSIKKIEIQKFQTIIKN